MLRREIIKTGIAGIGTLLLSKTTSAISLASTSSTQKEWAIFYSSNCGSTRDAANWINEGLGEIADVIDVATDPDISAYEHVIIGGWIQAGNLIQNVKTFISDNKSDLQPKIKGLFTVCGNNGNPVGSRQVSDYLTNQIVKFTGAADVPAKLFNGRSDPDCNHLGISYDELKKDDCVEFGESIFSTAVNAPAGLRHMQALSLRVSPGRPGIPVHFGYHLPATGMVVLTITTPGGTVLTTLVSERQSGGHHEVRWNAKNTAPGMYLCRLRFGSHGATRTVRIPVF